MSSPCTHNPQTLGIPFELCKLVFSFLPWGDVAQVNLVDKTLGKIARESLNERQELTPIEKKEWQKERFFSRLTNAQRQHVNESNELYNAEGEDFLEIALKNDKRSSLNRLKKAIENEEFKKAKRYLASLEKIDIQLQNLPEIRLDLQRLSENL